VLRTIRVTNDYIARTHTRANMFATVFLGALDPAAGGLRYVNAGHDPPMLIGPEGVRQRLEPTGPAVGMLPDVEFQVREVRIAPGDTVLAYTDGVTDARAPGGEAFGDDGLERTVASPPPSAAALLECISGALEDHTAGADPFDDVTLLAVHRATAGGGR
jgi:sigma-B regulation protein RsbU (phosphoserine phosphatase)